MHHYPDFEHIINTGSSNFASRITLLNNDRSKCEYSLTTRYQFKCPKLNFAVSKQIQMMLLNQIYIRREIFWQHYIREVQKRKF